MVDEAPIELGHIHCTWHAPGMGHPDVAALDVLSVVLGGGGRSSRLHREVREKAGVVHSVDVGMYNPGEAGLFGLSAVADGDRYEAATRAMLAEVGAGAGGGADYGRVGEGREADHGVDAERAQDDAGAGEDLGGSWMLVGDLGFSGRDTWSRCAG